MEVRKSIGLLLARMSTIPAVSTLQRIAYGLRAEGYRVSENQLKQVLSAMEDDGIVKENRIDYTQMTIEWLLHQEAGFGVICPVCEKRSFVSLYSQTSDDVAYARKRNIHRKVGGYCMNCRGVFVDTKIDLL